MPDYSNGKVYKIVCNITGEQYFGSTTQKLSQRLSTHRSEYKRRIKCKSSQIIERGDYKIVLCEKSPCENREQLKSIERKWIEENECVNKCMPIRSVEEKIELKREYTKNTREQKQQYDKEYRQKNIEKK